MKKTIFFFTGIILFVEIITTNNLYAQAINKTSIFDYSRLIKFKEVFINDLKINSNPMDVLLTTFLEDYSKLVEEYNTMLNENEPLNNSLYVHDSTDNYILLRKELESNGLRLEESEGQYYIDMNSNYLKSINIDLLDELSIEFLNLYCDELDEICCEDGGIQIQKQKLVQRAYKWGEFMEKSSNNSFKEISGSEYDRYIYFIFKGLDNTPAFDWDTGKYNNELLLLMKDIIAKYPNSRASGDFQTYLKLLKESNFEFTDKISAYLEKL